MGDVIIQRRGLLSGSYTICNQQPISVFKLHYHPFVLATMALDNSPGYFQPIGEALDNTLIGLFRYN